MSEFVCPDCGGGFPHPTKWQANWVCPWCYEPFMRNHTHQAFSYGKAGQEFLEVAEPRGEDGDSA